MTKQEQSAMNSGKGLSRVEIAQRARDRAFDALKAAELRLEKALEAETATAANRKEKEGKKRERAIAALVAIGKTRKEAEKLLGL